ncbi:MAG TPA: hypothetical protein VEW07_01060 [Solirubrobacterales bacterium]|nr:hypothetical protein [Solirubrobacterales bacterium]
MNFRYFRRLLVAVAALAAFTALVPAGAAATSTPAAGYEQFTGCPHPGQNPLIETCFRSVISGGELQMGNVEVPITSPITLSGGMTASGTFDFNSNGGLQQAKQTVPGGVIGFTGFTWLAEVLPPASLVLRAVIELAGTPGDQLAQPASLPVKVHFLNQILGNKCYVGSNVTPLKLQLITGTTSPPPPNSPISGSEGSVAVTSPSGITDITKGINVDNSFASPGASGCVLTLFGYLPISIDIPINTQSALPSPAGSNTTIQKFNAEHVAAVAVYP